MNHNLGRKSHSIGRHLDLQIDRDLKTTTPAKALQVLGVSDDEIKTLTLLATPRVIHPIYPTETNVPKPYSFELKITPRMSIPTKATHVFGESPRTLRRRQPEEPHS